MGGNPHCFISVYFCFICVLKVFTSAATSPYPFYFVFMPRLNSNREVVWFGELAVFCPDFCASPKTLVLSARMRGIFDIFYSPSPGCYLTFISRPLFYLSHRSTLKKFIFTVCSVLTDFCLYLHLPLYLFLLLFFWWGGGCFKRSCDSI